MEGKKIRSMKFVTKSLDVIVLMATFCNKKFKQIVINQVIK